MDTDAQRQETVEVVERFFELLERIDIEAFVELWAEDGIQVMPFSPEGFPDRLEGKEAIRRQYGGMPDAYRSMRFQVEVEPMLEPARAVAQYQGTIELADGGHYDNRYCGIFEVRHRKIVQFTEYFDPIVLQRAFGGGSMDATFGLDH